MSETSSSQGMPPRRPRPPVAGLVDAFSDEFGDLASQIIPEIKKNLDTGMEVRTAVNSALTRLGVGQAITDAILSKLVTAAAIGFGVEPAAVVDPIGIRRTFLNHHWPGDEFTLSDRIARAEFRQVIISAIESQMLKGRSWTKMAQKLTDPLRLGGGPDFVEGDVTRNLERLRTAARSFAPDSPGAVKALQLVVTRARTDVKRLGRRGAPNQTLKVAYKQVIDAAESLKLDALDKAIDQAVRDKARYNAERIARTEIARAYGAGHDVSSLQDTDVIASRIILSSRHPKPDICDFHAKSDHYGMGPGVFPKGMKPSYPFHPHCLCIWLDVFKGEIELKSDMDRTAGPRYLQGLSKRDREAMLGVAGNKEFEKNPSKWQSLLKSWKGHSPVLPPAGLKAAMFKPPAPAPVESPAEKLRTVEERIRVQRYESAAILDDKGDVIFFKDGNKNSVSFTLDEVRMMKGNILTHNHPSGWEYPKDSPKHGGNSFSEADIHIAAKGQAREIRAASPVFNHSMRPGANGWNEEYFLREIKPAFDEIQNKVKWESTQAIQAGILSIPEAEARHYHEVWTRVARKKGLIYSREKIDP